MKLTLAYFRPTDIFIQKKMGRSNLRCKMQDLASVPMATFYRALQIYCILISIQYNDCIPFLFLVLLKALCSHKFEFFFIYYQDKWPLCLRNTFRNKKHRSNTFQVHGCDVFYVIKLRIKWQQSFLGQEKKNVACW